MLTRQMSWCAERKALVASRPQSACRSCSLSGACGSSLLERFAAVDIELPVVDMDEPIAAGDLYMVQWPAVTFLAVCAGLFPGLALLMLGGSWFAAAVFPHAGELVAVAGAVAGLMLGALLLKLYDARFGSRGAGRRLIIEPSGRATGRYS